MIKVGQRVAHSYAMYRTILKFSLAELQNKPSSLSQGRAVLL